ncbi:MAG: hypothetical protein K1X95_01520 [Acidimicrobiia bacterium]|nr:hypothetical protein [Acidimicrobiia bacterium]
MNEIASLRSRVDTLGDLGLEGPGADEAAAELEAVADAVDALMQRTDEAGG